MRAALLGALASGAYSSAVWVEGYGVFSDGNRTLSIPSDESGNASTAAKSSGSWYAEAMISGKAGINSIGFVLDNAGYNAIMIGTGSSEWGLASGAVGKGAGPGLYHSNERTVSIPTFHQFNDMVMLAVNMTTGNMWFGRNGSWFAGDPAAGTGAMGSKGSVVGSMRVACTLNNDSGTFGASAFTLIDLLTYQPPAGFEPL